MRKYPNLTQEIFERYLGEYLNKMTPDLDEYELMYFESQYSGIMKNLTRNFIKEQFVSFYLNPMDFIDIMYNMFGLTRKLNYILFRFNSARISYLQQHGLNPRFEMNDYFEKKNIPEKFFRFKVIKK
jgi:hypothetical protein